MIMVLMPSTKTYKRMQWDDGMFEAKRRENNDPRFILQRILKCQYTDLGRTMLNGVEVQGFQTVDRLYAKGASEVDIRVWIDTKTQLPVRVDTKTKIDDLMEMEGTTHEFQWNVPVSAADFTPIIPADFTAAPGDGVKLPGLNEQTAVAGLKLCRDLSDKYPDDLDATRLIMMAGQLATGGYAQEPPPLPDSNASNEELEKSIEAFKKWKADRERSKKSLEDRRRKMGLQMGDREPNVGLMLEKMRPVQMLGTFYARLAREQRDPAYYGKIVKPGDAAQVLLRWKTGENEYRVIFGDLHALTVDPDTLAKLEAALPK
jgi:hypothetical protein